ncbi:PREDICTED: uncharacterized protein LOC106814216 [Priapulus caudatus]|uniref:Uncharacterized protein LOC106814216 n=1 Tax=Priapulus caudatus TaxID=37621 RepID=A0ABM1EP80_PRICU|nr:PREDICTED: uncharacterized protein LOC106814216 [Priapulus caudatus]
MKKKKRSAPPPAKPGVARQHLLDNYSEIPEDGDLKIGHVLYLFHENEKSVAKTIRAICSSLPVPCDIDPNAMKSIVNSFESFQNLGREADKLRFVELCAEHFTSFVVRIIPTEPMDTSTSSDTPDVIMQPHQPEPQPSTSVECATTDPHLSSDTLPSHAAVAECDTLLTPASVTPSPNLRHGFLTPRKLSFKKRLDFLSNQRSLQKQRYFKKVAKLKAKLDLERVTELKYMNQALARRKDSMKVKDAKITLLKKQLKQNQVGTAEEQLQALKCTHKRLKESNKGKRKNRKVCETVSKEEHMKVKRQLSEKEELVKDYENEICELREKLEEVHSTEKSEEKQTKKDGKTYGTNMRMMVYDSIVNQVPTQNIPNLIQNHAKRYGEVLTSVPHRTTVEQMARELDCIADLKSAELAMKTKDLTLGFDATTQEGVHINSIHFNTISECDLVAVDELPGGTAEDYHGHITASVDHLADTHSDYHQEEYQHCRSTIISNISNTMNDRAVVNQATIRKVNESWGKTLNELNCHLHPLDTIASKCRSTLKSLETENGNLFGNDSIIGNLVLQINKLRYKDGKGDPKGFKTFLDDNNLPRGLLPRYRGNRLHILFHICGKLFEHHELLLNFFSTGALSCGGLVSSLKKDFASKTALTEMQVLGLTGKLLTGPWMQTFYTSAENSISHMDGVEIVKNVLSSLRDIASAPLNILQQTRDFFGGELKDDDLTLNKLMIQPPKTEMFSVMLAACLKSIIEVIERQYHRYFEMDVTEQLREQTQSARCHNIDSEEIMGMFSAGKERAKHANLDFLVARMRGRKNKVVEWLDDMGIEKREKIVTWAIGRGRKKRAVNRKKDSEVRQELSRRAANKRQKITEKERKNIEKKLNCVEAGNLKTVFPEIAEDIHSDLVGILQGTVVGRNICHTWYDEETNEKTIWSGRIEKLKKRKGNIYCYKIAYWADDGSYEDAEDFEILKLALAADRICEDLLFC